LKNQLKEYLEKPTITLTTILLHFNYVSAIL